MSFGKVCSNLSPDVQNSFPCESRWRDKVKPRKILKEAIAYELALSNLYQQSRFQEYPEIEKFFSENAKLSSDRIKELRRLFQQHCGG